MNLTPPQKEELRHLVREYLAVRHPAAFTARAIRRHVATEIDFQVEDQDIADTCRFLAELGQVQVQADDLGSTQYFNATASGELAWERGQRP